MEKRRSIPIKTQRIVFERDSFKCQYCGKKARWIVSNGAGITQLFEKEPKYPLNLLRWNSSIDPIPFEIDHICPICEGGTNDLENLKLSCRYCNRSKSKWIG